MNVLFVCSGNSARGILAEALLNARAAGRARAYSAGSHPRAEVHPHALTVLATCGMATAGLRSKSWNEFTGDAAPHLDVVITLGEEAGAERSPLWPGAPVNVHWNLSDPAAAPEAEQLAAFAVTFAALERRIELLLSLPLDYLSPEELEGQLREVG